MNGGIVSMQKIIILSLICLLFFSGCKANFREKYTEEKVVEKIESAKYTSEEITYNEVDCILIEGLSFDDSSPNKLYFYIFNSESDAREAYDKDVSRVEDIFDIEEQSDNDIRYWEPACDAGIRRYEYLSKNLIIETTLNTASCCADYCEADWAMTPEIQEKIDRIKTNF